MTNVVRLKPRQAPVALSEAFGAAWAAFPDSGRIRSSRALAGAEWAKAAKDVGEERLLAAVRRYAAEDKDHKRDCGAPGFDRWLKWGRYDYWLRDEATVVPITQTEFPDPALRDGFHLAFKDERARRWLDRCGWDSVRREIINPGYALKEEWVNGPFRKWAVAYDVRGLVSR